MFKILVLRPIRLSKWIYGSNRFTILLVLKTNSFLAFSVLTFRISKISIFLARVVRLFNTISFRSLESRLARSKMLFSWMNMGRGKMFSKRSSLMYTPVLFPVIHRIAFFWNRSNCNWSPLDICVHESPYNNTGSISDLYRPNFTNHSAIKWSFHIHTYNFVHFSKFNWRKQSSTACGNCFL